MMAGIGNGLVRTPSLTASHSLAWMTSTADAVCERLRRSNSTRSSSLRRRSGSFCRRDMDYTPDSYCPRVRRSRFSIMAHTVTSGPLVRLTDTLNLC